MINSIFLLALLSSSLAFQWSYPYYDAGQSSFATINSPLPMTSWMRGLDSSIYTTAITPSGNIITVSGNDVVGLTPDNNIWFSYDATEGDNYGEYNIFSYGNGPLLIDENGIVYFLSSNFTKDAIYWRVHALSVNSDGATKIWSQDIDVATYSFATLAMENSGTIVVNLYSMTQQVFFGFKPTDGTIVWTKEFPSPFLYLLQNPTVGNLIFAGSNNHTLSTDTVGEFVWEQSFYFISNIAIDENNVAYGFGSEGLMAFNAMDGTPRWTVNIGTDYDAEWWVPIAVRNDRLFFAFTPSNAPSAQSANIAAYNASTGAQQWNTTVCKGDQCSWTAGKCNVAISDPFVFVGAGNNLVALSVETGTIVWVYNLGNELSASNIYLVNDSDDNLIIVATIVDNNYVDGNQVSILYLPFQATY